MPIPAFTVIDGPARLTCKSLEAAQRILPRTQGATIELAGEVVSRWRSDRVPRGWQDEPKDLAKCEATW